MAKSLNELTAEGYRDNRGVVVGASVVALPVFAAQKLLKQVFTEERSK